MSNNHGIRIPGPNGATAGRALRGLGVFEGKTTASLATVNVYLYFFPKN